MKTKKLIEFDSKLLQRSIKQQQIKGFTSYTAYLTFLIRNDIDKDRQIMLRNKGSVVAEDMLREFEEYSQEEQHRQIDKAI